MSVLQNCWGAAHREALRVHGPDAAGAVGCSSGRMEDSPLLGWDWAGELDLLVAETLTLPTGENKQ